jgi:hypothetical protein
MSAVATILKRNNMAKFFPRFELLALEEPIIIGVSPLFQENLLLLLLILL